MHMKIRLILFCGWVISCAASYVWAAGDSSASKQVMLFYDRPSECVNPTNVVLPPGWGTPLAKGVSVWVCAR